MASSYSVIGALSLGGGFSGFDILRRELSLLLFAFLWMTEGWDNITSQNPVRRCVTVGLRRVNIQELLVYQQWRRSYNVTRRRIYPVRLLGTQNRVIQHEEQSVRFILDSHTLGTNGAT